MEPPQARPVLIGVLRDHEAAGGADFQRAARLGIADVQATGRLDRELELVAATADALPRGTARAVEEAFGELDDRGVLAIIGPAISDNGLVARDLADARHLPTINYTGGEQTRSRWSFQYQIGSLEEEPTLLARHLRDRGLTRVVLVSDRSPIGRRYAEFFDEAAEMCGVAISGRVAVHPTAQDLADEVARLHAGGEVDALVYLGLGLTAFPLSAALAGAGWDLPVVANSALLFGHHNPDWTQGWQDWVYVDVIDEDNPVYADVVDRLDDPGAGPGPPSAYDLGRLVAEAVARAPHLTRAGVLEGLERIKQVPAALGRPGTTLGFGRFERQALSGEYLVLRRWRDGRSIPYEVGP